MEIDRLWIETQNAVKRLKTKAYLINEDILVRSGEITD